METLTQILRRAILDCGETRYALGRRTGIDSAVLSRFVRGERGLSSDSIDTLVAALDLEVRPRRRRKR
jgi:hypothetical protein